MVPRKDRRAHPVDLQGRAAIFWRSSSPTGSSYDQACLPAVGNARFALDNALPALFERRAATVALPSQQFLTSVDRVNQPCELAEFLLRELLPARRGRHVVRKREDECSDLLEREPQGARPLNHRQAIQGAVVVTPLPAYADSQRDNPYLFINSESLKV
jgi:hypothetical protein